MRLIKNIKLFLVGVLFILGLMVAHANPNNLSKEDKKIIYELIQFQLEEGLITVDEAQKIWVKLTK